jgi:predicted nucleotide-binding protein
VARKKTSTPESEQLVNPSLVLPREEVSSKLAERIKSGRYLQTSDVQSSDDMDKLRNEQEKWSSYNTEYLSRCFDIQAVSRKYSKVYGYGPMVMNPNILQKVDGFRKGIDGQITELESIHERLELIPEAIALDQKKPVRNSKASNSVFIVHGHDEVAKINVARFIDKLGLVSIILHEQANKGQTIIEKFESNAAEVGFAVVLLTPDDIGAPKDIPDETSLRARQNVVLELGYFCGALGRDKVCVLYKEGVEIPSDYLGVVYTQLDDSDGWHLKLAKEMKEAGLNVDLNNAI